MTSLKLVTHEDWTLVWVGGDRFVRVAPTAEIRDIPLEQKVEMVHEAIVLASYNEIEDGKHRTLH